MIEKVSAKKLAEVIKPLVEQIEHNSENHELVTSIYLTEEVLDKNRAIALMTGGTFSSKARGKIIFEKVGTRSKRVKKIDDFKLLDYKYLNHLWRLYSETSRLTEDALRSEVDPKIVIGTINGLLSILSGYKVPIDAIDIKMKGNISLSNPKYYDVDYNWSSLETNENGDNTMDLGVCYNHFYIHSGDCLSSFADNMGIRINDMPLSTRYYTKAYSNGLQKRILEIICI